MPGRQFRLESILSYREQIVELRQGELAALEKARFEQQAALDRLRSRLARQEAAIQAAQRAGALDCSDLLRQFGSLARLQAEEQQQAARVAELERQVEAQRERLRVAMQEKQVIEKLKERQMAEARQEETRKEGQLLDEIGVVRFHRTARENTSHG